MAEKRWQRISVRGLDDGRPASPGENAADIIVELSNRLQLKGEELKILGSERGLGDSIYIHIAVFTDQHIRPEITLKIPERN